MAPASSITVRAVERRDAPEWVRLRTDLWPDSSDDHTPEVGRYFREPSGDAVCFIAESADGRIVGFAEVGTRPAAEGCRTSPVGYLEGIHVSAEARRSGVGEALVAAAEEWSRGIGCTELASDRALDNRVSGAFHEAAGFVEVNRLVCYRKELGP